MLTRPGHLTSSLRKLVIQRVSQQCILTTVNNSTLLVESSDPEFDDYNVHFSALEQSTEKLLKDTKAYTDAVTCM